MVNYYELLEITPSANKEEISSAIRKTRRIWNTRANNPDGKIRAEAEQHIREIAEAENILLDDSRRDEYNQQLSQSQRSTVTNETVDTSSNDWEEEYFRAYDKDLSEYAAQVAKQAVQQNDKNGRAWFLYGEALRRSGSSEGAIGPLQRASVLLPDDAKVFRQLGFAYIDANRLGDALQAFFDASKCDPSDAEYYCLRATLFRNAEMIEDALREAKEAYKLAPNDDSVRFEYFSALYADVLKAMSYNRSSGKHLIINKVQLDYVKNMLKEMAQTIPEDSTKNKCSAAVDEVVKCVADAESRKGGFFTSKVGYQYNYDNSNADTRASGKH